MKRLIILIVVLCMMSVSYAQEKKCGMLDGEPAWSCYYVTLSGYLFYKCYLDGMVNIDGKTYHKLFMEVLRTGGTYFESGYLMGIREKDGRILASKKEFGSPSEYENCFLSYELTDEDEVVIYDFNVPKGHTYDMVNVQDNKVAYQRKVVDVDSVRLCNGEMRKRFTIDNNGEMYHIIENIGAIDWRWGVPFLHNCESFYMTTDDPAHCLNIFVQNGEVLYKAPDYEGDTSIDYYSRTTYKPDPFFSGLLTGIKDVNADKAAERDNSIYDLTGRKLSAKPEKGIYIQGGKKYVVR